MKPKPLPKKRIPICAQIESQPIIVVAIKAAVGTDTFGCACAMKLLHIEKDRNNTLPAAIVCIGIGITGFAAMILANV